MLLQKCVSTEPQRVDPAHCVVTSLMLRAKTNPSLYKLTVLGSYLQRKTNQHRGQIDFSGLLFRCVNAASSHTKLCSSSRMIQHTGGCGVHMHAHKCTWTPRKAKGIEGCGREEEFGIPCSSWVTLTSILDFSSATFPVHWGTWSLLPKAIGVSRHKVQTRRREA